MSRLGDTYGFKPGHNLSNESASKIMKYVTQKDLEDFRKCSYLEYIRSYENARKRREQNALK